MLASYIDVISTYFPTVQARANGSGFEYEQLVWEAGDPIPSKTILDAKCLELAQARAWALIQNERDRRKSGGIKVGANWFHSDDPSRIQQLGLVMMGASLPAGIMWKTLGGNFVLMTPLLAQQIFMTSAASDQAIFAKAEYHKAMMLREAIPSSYNYLTGWPLTYGE